MHWASEAPPPCSAPLFLGQLADALGHRSTPARLGVEETDRPARSRSGTSRPRQVEMCDIRGRRSRSGRGAGVWNHAVRSLLTGRLSSADIEGLQRCLCGSAQPCEPA